MSPFELTKSPLSLIDNLIVNQVPQKKEEEVKKKQVVDIIALTKQYLAQDQPDTVTFYGNENIEEDEMERQTPVESSRDLVNFCEKRRHYLINLKS